MPTEVILPRVDMDMAEGRISRWYVEEGASVAKGQPIFEIETDKAAMEVEAPASGVIRGLCAALDAALPVGTTVAWIDAEGEIGEGGASNFGKPLAASGDDAHTSRGRQRPPSPLAGEGAPDPRLLDIAPNGRRIEAGGRGRERGNHDIESGSPSPSLTAFGHPLPQGERESAAAPVPNSRPNQKSVTPIAPSGERNSPAQLRATPLARRLARESGLDLMALSGTGPKGRVQAADVQARASLATGSSANGARIAGGALHRQWLRRGEGAPLVLLHGFGADLNAWRLFLATARPGCPALGIDLPGHGGSADRRVASFDDMVEEVASTLRAEGLESGDSGAIHLVGHSLGGAVATALAGHEAIAARSLFLLAPAGLGPDMNGAFVSGFLRARGKASLEPWIELLASDPAALGPAFAETILRQRGGSVAGLEHVAATVFPDGTQGFSVRSVLERLSIPVKIVFGTDDRIIPARHALGLPGRIAIHMFREIGHMPHFEARDEVAGLLLELMRSA
jgi:pimeloyl-ACP methyl ester carboxylesterase